MKQLGARLRELADDTESGQAMVEFVLVFPMQLFLTLAILQFAFICKAQLVVGQAAFLGARAAAVSDMLPMSGAAAAKRVVARQVALLTTGDPGVEAEVGVDPPAGSEMIWQADGGRWGYPTGRQREAYGLLGFTPTVEHTTHADYVSCRVEYDYVLTIPVANHFFALLNTGPRMGRTVFRIKRVGFVATPWNQPPVDNP